MSMTMRSVELMDSLRDVLVFARQQQGISYAQVAAQAGKVENAIRRFEKGKSGPAYKDIDPVVVAYAVVTGYEPEQLWQAAFCLSLLEGQVRTRLHPEISELDQILEGERLMKGLLMGRYWGATT